MIFMHVQCLEFHFCFTFGIKRSEVVLEFCDKEIEIREPDGVVQAEKCGFKTIQCDPLQMGKGLVDLIFFSVEEILVVPKIQFSLKNEATKFLGIGIIKWIRYLLELGIRHGRMGLDEFIDSCDNSDSVCFLRINCSWSVIRSFIIHGINLY